MNRRRFLDIFGKVAAGAVATEALSACSSLTSLVRGCGSDPEERWPAHTARGKALIINGDQFEERHMENVLNAYHFFLGIGYGTKDITVLGAPFESFGATQAQRTKEWLQQQYGFVPPELAGPATKRNVVASLEQAVQTEGELFVYITGHGGAAQRSSFAELNAPFPLKEYDTISDDAVQEILRRGKYNGGVMLFDGCEGEGFSQKIGDERTTAITKNQFGDTSNCRHFSDRFFYTPWDLRFGALATGGLTLQEVVQEVSQELAGGGAEGKVQMKGGYNPLLVTAIARQPALYMSFLPSDPVQSAPMTLADDLEYLQSTVLKGRDITVVNNEKAMSKALAARKGVFYQYWAGCEPCVFLSPHVTDALQQDGAVAFYLLPADYEGKETAFEKPVREAFGLNEGGYPQLYHVREGKVAERIDGVPLTTVSYGIFPDKIIQVIDREKIKEFMKR